MFFLNGAMVVKSVSERQRSFIFRQKLLGRKQRYFWVSDTELHILKKLLKELREGNRKDI